MGQKKKKKIPRLLFFRILVCIIINHIWALLYVFPNPIIELRTSYQNSRKTHFTGPPHHHTSPDSLSPPVRLGRFRSLWQKRNYDSAFLWNFIYCLFIRFVADLASFADTWNCLEFRRQFWFSLKKYRNLFFSPFPCCSFIKKCAEYFHKDFHEVCNLHKLKDTTVRGFWSICNL